MNERWRVLPKEKKADDGTCWLAQKFTDLGIALQFKGCVFASLRFINVMGRFIETFCTGIVCVLLTPALVLHLVLESDVCSSIALGLKGFFNFA